MSKKLSKQVDKLLSQENIRSNPPRLLSVSEAARYIGISERNLRGLIAERKIPFVRIRRRIVFRLVDLDRWIAEHVEGVAL